MTVVANSELESFHQFVGDRLRNGCAEVSPEQVLARWRERNATIESVRRGIADVDAGRTRPADDVLAELRSKKLGID